MPERHLNLVIPWPSNTRQFPSLVEPLRLQWSSETSFTHCHYPYAFLLMPILVPDLRLALPLLLALAVAYKLVYTLPGNNFPSTVARRPAVALVTRRSDNTFCLDRYRIAAASSDSWSELTLMEESTYASTTLDQYWMTVTHYHTVWDDITANAFNSYLQ
ncbi:hypothetical protein BDP27DRAFT_1419172 [Rhodocollybia butyracea]|uniref:Uncharacterized protein n=1 Tax=Rhodocollybia butyracea TaxID=206335 RepID=A0A9P5PWS7_9AGAR|nr:hypothetical protein BDP27DRAFT_1419172 [Rhodocollybia butyracea]